MKSILHKIYASLPVSDKTRKDTIWNIIALGLYGFSAIFISIIISSIYSPEVLGIFNLSFATFVIASQFAGLGIHNSSLFKLSNPTITSDEQRIILSNGLITVIIASFFTALITYLLIPVLSYLFDSDSESICIVYILPAIFLLPVNKVLLSFLNARSEMIKFGFANVIRAISMFTCFGIIIHFEFDYFLIPSIFSAAEFFVFIIYVYLLKDKLQVKGLKQKIIKKHVSFGLKSLMGSIFLDINTKVDIIIIGLLLSNYEVGMYTLPALIIEGFQQIPLVFRNVINPKITSDFTRKGKDALATSINRGKSISFKLLTPILIIIVVLFIISLFILNLEGQYKQAIYILIILAVCNIAVMGYFPFILIFNQLGLPALQSKFLFYIISSNIFFNVILIPVLGIFGAAVGTGLSYLVMLVLIRKFLRDAIHIKI